MFLSKLSKTCDPIITNKIHFLIKLVILIFLDVKQGQSTPPVVYDSASSSQNPLEDIHSQTPKIKVQAQCH